MDLHIVTDNRLSLKLMSSRNSFEANYCYFDYIISQGIRVYGAGKRREEKGGGGRRTDYAIEREQSLMLGERRERVYKFKEGRREGTECE